jgi:hypothetical protein
MVPPAFRVSIAMGGLHPCITEFATLPDQQQGYGE